jgi:hypothetical protein
MVEMRALDLQHLDELAVLVVKGLNFLLALLFDSATPWERSTLGCEERDDFE